MIFQVKTWSNAEGIQKQILVIGNDEFEINGLNLWEGEVLKVKNKEYELSLLNWRHNIDGSGLDFHQYELVEVDYYVVRDGTELISHLIGSKFHEVFK